MDPIQTVAPVLGGVSLILGTGTAMMLDVAHRRQTERLRRVLDEESGIVKQEKQNELHVKQLESANDDNTTSVNDTQSHSIVDSENDSSSLRLPIVSAATSRFGSVPYTIFVSTAFIHAFCLLVTSYYQYQGFRHSNIDYEKTSNLLQLCAASIAGASIVLASLIPGKGRTRCPNAIFGILFLESSIMWMIWTCMLTQQRKSPLFGLQVTLASFAMAALTWAAYFVWQTMAQPKGSDCWRWYMHLSALGQVLFGLCYGMFLASLVVLSF